MLPFFAYPGATEPEISMDINTIAGGPMASIYHTFPQPSARQSSVTTDPPGVVAAHYRKLAADHGWSLKVRRPEDGTVPKSFEGPVSLDLRLEGVTEYRPTVTIEITAQVASESKQWNIAQQFGLRTGP